ncbi:hypothetical protein [Prochlorothrix hollandica]|uniref:hypothetical protein n=1 Tax=Prochlorothrix hollandica TaxID=1223 RepID=UPI00034771B1|nr:hypothetical protein [Prochlorothrix hollandica]
MLPLSAKAVTLRVFLLIVAGLIGLGGAARHNPYSCVGTGARIWIFEVPVTEDTGQDRGRVYWFDRGPSFKLLPPDSVTPDRVNPDRVSHNPLNHPGGSRP